MINAFHPVGSFFQKPANGNQSVEQEKIKTGTILGQSLPVSLDGFTRTSAPKGIHFQGKAQKTRLDAIPVHNLMEPVAVIDIGSANCKFLLYLPDEQRVIAYNYKVALGNSLRDNNGELSTSALNGLETALRNCKSRLEEYKIAPENLKVVASAGLRDAKQGEQIAEHLANNLKLPIQIISPEKESAYLYRSIMRDQAIKPYRDAVVIEIGGGSTEIIWGKGTQNIDKNLTEQGYFPLGSGKINLKYPFSVNNIAGVRRTIATQLQRQLPASLSLKNPKAPVFLSCNDLYKVLADIEEKRTDGTHHIADDGLDLKTINWYLSEKGLRYLKGIDKAGTYSAQFGPDTIKSLIGKLVFAAELAKYLNIDTFQFGSPGGMRSGLMAEVTRNQIRRRTESYGKSLHTLYKNEYGQTQQALFNIFPDLAHNIHGRVKDPVSITDKLTRKALRTGNQSVSLKRIDDALSLIGDGHGLSLVLDDASPANIRKIRESLIKAIQTEQVQILEINNYHGKDNEAKPYLTSEDIAEICLAAAIKKRTTLSKVQPPDMEIQDGSKALKASGYITTQLCLRLKNPVTHEFDLSDCELQIRGKEVNSFYSAEHLIYDLAQGKDPYKGNKEIRKSLQGDLEPLIQAIQKMSKEQFGQYSDYLNHYYAYCRNLEDGKSVREPELPAGLPEVCGVQNVKRLNERQQYLIAQYH